MDEVQKIGSGGENESFPLNERLMVYKYIIEKEGIITIEENGEINIKDKDNKQGGSRSFHLFRNFSKILQSH